MDHAGEPASTKDFFISYTKVDEPWAVWIAWHLEAAGYKVTVQSWDFLPGGNFVLDMHRALRECERTLVVLSPDYLKSTFTQPEWAAIFAADPMGQHQRLLPVRVRAVRPDGLLAPISYVDLVDKHEPSAIALLLAAAKKEVRVRPIAPPAFPGAGPAFPGAGPAFPSGTSSSTAAWLLSICALGMAVANAALMAAPPIQNGTFELDAIRAVIVFAALAALSSFALSLVGGGTRGGYRVLVAAGLACRSLQYGLILLPWDPSIGSSASWYAMRVLSIIGHSLITAAFVRNGVRLSLWGLAFAIAYEMAFSLRQTQAPIVPLQAVGVIESLVFTAMAWMALEAWRQSRSPSLVAAGVGAIIVFLVKIGPVALVPFGGQSPPMFADVAPRLALTRLAEDIGIWLIALSCVVRDRPRPKHANAAAADRTPDLAVHETPGAARRMRPDR